MDSIGTNITTALDVVRQIDEQAGRLVRQVQILEKINQKRADRLDDLRRRVEQLDAENDRLNDIIGERNDRIAELAQANSARADVIDRLNDRIAELEIALNNAEATQLNERIREQAATITTLIADRDGVRKLASARSARIVELQAALLKVKDTCTAAL